MIHELKREKRFFDAVINGEKTFEILKDDGGFRVGDLLALNETDGGHYTGRSCVVEITYALSDTQYVAPGYAALSIKPVGLSFARDWMTDNPWVVDTVGGEA